MKKRPTQHPVEIPGWAAAGLLPAARAVAWEGEMHPLNVSSIFPANSPLGRMLPIHNGIRWHQAIHPLDRERVSRFFQALPPGGSGHIDYRITGKGGNALWLRHRAEYIIEAAGRRIVRGFVFDINEEKQYQLDSLRAGARERTRIGQDLHDDICQILTGVSCLLQVSAGRLSDTVPDETARLHDINERVIEAMNRARAICRGLSPLNIINGEGIRSALTRLARQFEERFPVKVAAGFSRGRLPAHTADQVALVYGIVQEALCNAVRHGGATKIFLRLEAMRGERKKLRVDIQDNGSGFPRRKAPPDGLGMRSMAYRASLLGGEIAVDSASAHGAIVRLTYSLSRQHPTPPPASLTHL